MQSIVKLDSNTTAAPNTDILPGWKVIDGSPSMKTWVLHTNKDGKMVSGLWEATPGTYHATYSDYEFVHIMAGRIVITPDGGTPVTVQAGDAFVVEADFVGTWEIQEAVRKHFDIKIP